MDTDHFQHFLLRGIAHEKELAILTVILLAALCLLFAGCAEQAAEPDGSAQDLLNLNDGADEVPADDGLDDTADESYPAEEDLAAFARNLHLPHTGRRMERS